MNLFEMPHRRFNPLTGEYVLVSPQRARRPWQGRIEPLPPPERPHYDPTCYLCPGNERSGGAVNPEYTDTFVFTNDFRALLDLEDPPEEIDSALLQAAPVRGTNRVLCYSPRHDLTLATMPVAAIERVIASWIEQVADLGKTYRWVQVFQNQGEMMGASNPHPHGQIWAVDVLPNEAAREDSRQRSYHDRYHTALLRDYLEVELEAETRLVLSGEHWTVLVPFWAVWPFETLVLPHRHVSRMTDLQQPEITDLARVLKQLLSGCDRLFDTPFPYSMGWHAAPSDGMDPRHWQLHAHFYPPLLRSATVRKFMVGYEMLAEAQRDLTAEQAAEALRAVVVNDGSSAAS